ncbi:MAG: hypothetical protein NT007_03015 [Candidatus Kapabacteria bacterium]|nr:hypothetical protein [Candidatus Kapabacteria bacterium]
MKRIIFVIAVLILAKSLSYAEENEKKYSNHLAMFIGATSNTSAGGWTRPSVGLDYELRLWSTKPLMGLGLFAESTFGNDIEYVFGLPIIFHPWKGLKAFIAPSMILQTAEPIKSAKSGIIKVQRQIQAATDDSVETSTKKAFIRLGLSYDFHLRRYSISPAISADIIESKLYLVYGINLGLSF